MKLNTFGCGLSESELRQLCEYYGFTEVKRRESGAIVYRSPKTDDRWEPLHLWQLVEWQSLRKKFRNR